MRTAGLPKAKSPELRAALKALEVDPKKPEEYKKTTADYKAEAHSNRREQKHAAMMTARQRSNAERRLQRRLTFERARTELISRLKQILQGIRDKESRTEMGIVLPSAEQIGAVLSGVGRKKVG